MSTPEFNLVARAVEELTRFDRNARTHSEAQVAQIAASIEEFGFTNPVLIDESNTILAGEGRVLAAKKLNRDRVPCVVIAGLSDAQKAAYVIADNKLGLNSDWNLDVLRDEVLRLTDLKVDLDLTGLHQLEIKGLFDDGDDDIAAIVNKTPKAKVDSVDWSGMPQFKQNDNSPFRTLLVHFGDQAAVDDFMALVGQQLTDKTKFIWHPKQVKTPKSGVVYA